MRLSLLQKHILREAIDSRSRRFPRRGLVATYAKLATTPLNSEEAQQTITRSLERLIDKGLLIGYGRRTPKKWFIDEIQLTALGRRSAKRLLGEQQTLPLFRRRVKH